MIHANRNDTAHLIQLLSRFDNNNYAEHVQDIMRHMFFALGVKADVELLDEWLAPKTKLYMTTRIISKCAPENVPTSLQTDRPEHTSDTSCKMTSETSRESTPDMTSEDNSNMTSDTIPGTIAETSGDTTSDTTSKMTSNMTSDACQKRERNGKREKNDEAASPETASKNVRGALSKAAPDIALDTSAETYSGTITETSPHTSDEAIANPSGNTNTSTVPKTMRKQDGVTRDKTNSSKSSPPNIRPHPADDPFAEHADECDDTCSPSTLDVVQPMRKYVSTVPILDHTMRIEYDATALHAGMLPNLIGTLSEELSEHDTAIAFSRFFFRSLVLANGYGFDFAQTPDDMPTLMKNIAFLLVGDKDFAEALCEKTAP